MKAVLLAAGESRRMLPVTANRPKPLIPVFDEPLLLHSLRLLEGRVESAVVVVGYGGSAIRDAVGDSAYGVPIRYVEQPERLGTGDAVLRAKEHLSSPFLVMMGDDLYGEEDLDACLDPSLPYPCRMLGARSEHPERYGVLVTEGQRVVRVVEKPSRFVSDLVNNGLYLLDPTVFPLLEGLSPSDRGEIEITDALSLLGERGLLGYSEVPQKLALSYPWDLLKAHETLFPRLEERLEGRLERNVRLQGTLRLGKNAVIRSGSIVEGPVWIGEDCDIGPCCTVGPFTCLGAGCRIGSGAEVVNSVLMNRVTVGQGCVVGHSILGEGVFLGEETFTQTEAKPGGTVLATVQGRQVDTGRIRYGAVLGDRATTGRQTVLFPGVRMWPGTSTRDKERVERDKRKTTDPGMR